MAPEYFQDQRSIFARAAQAYLILIADATAGRVVTYEELASRMEPYVAPGLGRTLDRITSWTKERDLPDLAAIVVGKESGRPTSLGEPGVHPYAISLEQWPAMLAKVREEKWFSVIPPTAADIDQAWARFLAQSGGQDAA